ncbi:MAG TPA: hypothetical protein VEP90_21325 [Methylomirabilota bacterium]|nr:hypothetical protein [Methylomirabilota bacterium]
MPKCKFGRNKTGSRYQGKGGKWRYYCKTKPKKQTKKRQRSYGSTSTKACKQQGKVRVGSYHRDDGTYVHAHCRKK